MFAALETKFVHRNCKLVLGIFIFRNCRLTSFAKKWLVKIIVVELKIVCISRVLWNLFPLLYAIGEISVNVKILSLSGLCLNINACKVVLSYFSSLVYSPFHVRYISKSFTCYTCCSEKEELSYHWCHQIHTTGTERTTESCCEVWRWQCATWLPSPSRGTSRRE